MKRVLGFFSVILLVLGTWPISPSGIDHEGADAWVLDVMNDSLEKTNLTFESGGGDIATANLILPQDVPVYTAGMSIEGYSDNSGEYPESVWLDVGGDGDLEWEFAGQGYGGLGRQYRFLSNKTAENIILSDGFTNNDVKIRLPIEAKVTNATMRIEGTGGDNNGMMLKRHNGTTCGLQMYSNNLFEWMIRPKLTVNYNEGGSTVIQPDQGVGKDTRIIQGSSVNYGTTMYILQNDATEERALLEFDLSTVDDQKTVSTAALTVRSYSNDNNQDWGVHETTEPWAENTATGVNQPSHDPNAVDVVHISWSGGASQYINFDVTDLVEKWLSGAPANVTLDFGEDGIIEYTMKGRHDFANTTADITDELNQYLGTAAPSFTDEFGTPFVDFPIKAASSDGGSLGFYDLDIRYKWTARVEKNPHSLNLVGELNGLMETLAPMNGKVTIPLKVHSDSAGKVWLGDVNITYNGAPILIKDIPSNMSLDEDTAVEHFLDLSTFFIDDYLHPDELNYSVLDNEMDDRVDVYIVDEHWLAVDSDSMDASENWHGELDVTIRATDEIGFYADSNDFMITVDPVNDEPVVWEDAIPDISLFEGGTSVPLDLDDDGFYFLDVDGDPLIFEAVVDPLGIFNGENITVIIDNISKDLFVKGNGDFSGSMLPLRIFCDDGIGPVAGVYQDIIVDVEDLNDDPPVWSAIPDIHVEEDGYLEDALNLEDHVFDIDNLIGSLDYTIISNHNESMVEVIIDKEHYIDVKTLKNNWTGETTVRVRAKDDGGNFADSTFRVFVDPVNDLPVVMPRSPVTGSTVSSSLVTLKWDAVDAETALEELEYSIYMGRTSPAELVAEGVSGTSHNIAVEDGSTYHWTVSAHDGVENGRKARERTFSVDLSLGPKVTLLSPGDGALVTGKSVQLSWTSEDRAGEDGGRTTYKVFMGEVEGALDERETEIAEMQWTVGGLQNDRTYFWTVIPVDDLGPGTCISGVWSFTTSFDFAGYGVGLDVSTQVLHIQAGTSGTFIATVQNTGAADDNYRLSGEIIDVPGVTLTFDIADAELIPIGLGAMLDVTVTVDIPSAIADGTYTLIITAQSLKGGMEAKKDLQVTVGEEVENTTDKDKESSGSELNMILLLILVIALLVCMMTIMFIMYRKKGKREEDRAKARRLEPAGPLDAELMVPATGLSAPALGPGGSAGAPRPQIVAAVTAPAAPLPAINAPTLVLPPGTTGGAPQEQAGTGEAPPTAPVGEVSGPQALTVAEAPVQVAAPDVQPAQGVVVASGVKPDSAITAATGEMPATAETIGVVPEASTGVGLAGAGPGTVTGELRGVIPSDDAGVK